MLQPAAVVLNYRVHGYSWAAFPSREQQATKQAAASWRSSTASTCSSAEKGTEKSMNAFDDVPCPRWLMDFMKMENHRSTNASPTSTFCLVKCRRGSKLPLFMFIGIGVLVKYLCQMCCPLPEKSNQISCQCNCKLQGAPALQCPFG